ncbi:MAG: RluA family pseudouridine synthase [Clostridia bacterium]
MKKFEITANKNGKLLTILPAEVEEISFASASKALRKKDIKVNGNRVSENLLVFAGDNIEIYLPDEASKPIAHYEVVYEDENIMVVNKKKGIEVCDGENSLQDRISSEKQMSISACHRIDRNTEGLVIFSKNQMANMEITNAFKTGVGLKKFYLAEVVGVVPKDMILKGFLVKNEEESNVKIFNSPVQGALKIVTKVKVLKKTANTSVLEIELTNGKTHQIRAHLAYAGYPLIGDGKYGKNEDNKKFKTKTQLLCAHKIVFEFEPSSPLAYLNEVSLEISPSWIK